MQDELTLRPGSATLSAYLERTEEMPTYDYECQNCGHVFEHFQSIKSEHLKKCPKCSKNKVKRLLGAGSGILFKGSGFYQTDYRSSSYTKGVGADKPAPVADKTPAAADKTTASADKTSAAAGKTPAAAGKPANHTAKA